MVLVAGAMNVTYDGEKSTALQLGSYAYGPANKPHTLVAFNELLANGRSMRRVGWMI
jgi:quercetin dioxygenase-like cupin family protein